MPSANRGMQQAFPLHLNFALEKGYDEAFHTEKMQDWLLAKNIYILAARLTLTHMVSNYVIPGSSVRWVGGYFIFLL